MLVKDREDYDGGANGVVPECELEWAGFDGSGTDRVDEAVAAGEDREGFGGGLNRVAEAFWETGVFA
jgi:hypothetical protein